MKKINLPTAVFIAWWVFTTMIIAKMSMSCLGLSVLTICVTLVMGVEVGVSLSSRSKGWWGFSFHLVAGAMLLLVAALEGITFGDSYGFFLDGDSCEWHTESGAWWYALYALLAVRTLVLQPLMLKRARKN